MLHYIRDELGIGISSLEEKKRRKAKFPRLPEKKEIDPSFLS